MPFALLRTTMALLSPWCVRAGPTRAVLAAAWLSLAGAWGPATLAAQEMDVPMATQWSLYNRILQFDRQFEARADDGIVVGVLYQDRFRPSTLARDELMQIAGRTSLQLGGRDVRFVSIEVTTPREVELELAEQGVDVIYFTPLRGAPLSELAELSIEHRLVTLTGVRQYMELGVAIGLGLRGGRPEILVNLASCEAQGLELSSELLKLATVVADH